MLWALTFGLKNGMLRGSTSRARNSVVAKYGMRIHHPAFAMRYLAIIGWNIVRLSQYSMG